MKIQQKCMWLARPEKNHLISSLESESFCHFAGGNQLKIQVFFKIKIFFEEYKVGYSFRSTKGGHIMTTQFIIFREKR